VLEARRRLDILIRNPLEREEQARREKTEAELAKTWEAVQGTDDQAKLRDFIRRYPATQYTDAAKRRLALLVVRPAQEREEAARAAAAEERRLKVEAEMKRDFDSAEATSDQAVVRDFIRRYPDSPYLTQAKKHLDTLIAAEPERGEQERIAAAEARRQKMEGEAAAAWNSVKNSSSPAEVQNFIKRFPESTLALKDATERLGALDREARELITKAQAEAASRVAWDRIKDTNDVAVVLDFIEHYPNTPVLIDAKRYLDVLDKRMNGREAKARMETEAAQVRVERGEKRVALLIGNSSYVNVPTLPNPIRDATYIDSILRKVGFETVILRNDLTRERMMTSFHAVVSSSTDAR
jgi:outer membrane protein assembly factor BamD (BamD/ComL family)